MCECRRLKRSYEGAAFPEAKVTSGGELCNVGAGN